MKKLTLILFVLFVLPTSAMAKLGIYLEKQISVEAARITAVKMSADGRFLAFGSDSGKVFVWDIQAKQKLHELSFHKDRISTLVFDNRNAYLVSGSADEYVVVWDLYTGEIKKKVNAYDVNHMEISPDNRSLLVSGEKDYLILYEFPLLVKKGALKGGHESEILYATYNLNGDQIVSVGTDNQMIFWESQQLKTIRKNSISPHTISGSGTEIRSAQASSDKHIIGVGYQELKLAKGGRRMLSKHNMAFYEWKTGKEIEILENNNKSVDFLSITPDKNYVITDNSTLRKKRLSFWNLQSGMVELNYAIDGVISTSTISLNGKWMATAYSTKNEDTSLLNLFSVSGIDGYKSFDYDRQLKQTQRSGFGSAIKLTSQTEPIIRLGQTKKMAVMYFDHLGVPEDIAKTTTNLLESKIGNCPQVELVERNQIKKVLDELKYQMSGLTTSEAILAGKHLNAEYMLLGSINKLGTMLIITTKLVNVETAKIEGTREVQCTNATIENIADMIVALAPAIVKF